MNEKMKADADAQITAYRAAPAKHRKARAEAARIQAERSREGSPQQAYWIYIATSLLA
ncbi:TPA: hypothetical protein QDC51_001239 [Burkholderia multivorans]|uniref:hypothetical protein n=1 Tax=Burkholderia multivorans TaxID=87883 RepID=UPI001C2383D8|nr:hypothetical protein [Burkholderia multivorans]MBU9351710.1 hypothetical protein [Burkholderia multivorans]MBU9394935.1 hypothetical protein [Burkholderia multivorans]HDR9834481.1 hypothetical protein [Burkholderia multivorans]HDR9840425.1 hypothetical protein [Burkholderia multivorans]HDR9846428.1 hypothetical protein [Burkholderia multivorans]